MCECNSTFNLCGYCGRCPEHHAPTRCRVPVKPTAAPTWFQIKLAQLRAREAQSGEER